MTGEPPMHVVVQIIIMDTVIQMRIFDLFWLIIVHLDNVTKMQEMDAQGFKDFPIMISCTMVHQLELLLVITPEK